MPSSVANRSWRATIGASAIRPTSRSLRPIMKAIAETITPS